MYLLAEVWEFVIDTRLSVSAVCILHVRFMMQRTQKVASGQNRPLSLAGARSTSTQTQRVIIVGRQSTEEYCAAVTPVTKSEHQTSALNRAQRGIEPHTHCGT
jgi:hypothetical protein